MLKIRFIILFLIVLYTGKGFAQNPINKIYTDFNGFWSTDSTTKFPNNSHNLLAFRIGTFPNDTIFSTGVNDDLLTSKGINYMPVNYKSIPSKIGQRSGASYFIGIGSNYGGVWQPPTPGYVIPNRLTPEYYLNDGVQGLDLGTAIFNIPAASKGITYQVDQFNISRIGDKIPDIVVTQVGDPSNTVDTFKFVDANGVIVGNSILVNFSTTINVGTAHWSFYNVSDGLYPNSQPGLSAGATTIQKRENPRLLRILQWDLSAFGLNTSNVGNVVGFIHVLRGTSDPAFVSYNTTSFRALGDIKPSCTSIVDIPVWLQANRGIEANTNNQLLSWKNDGISTSNAEQNTPSIAPIYNKATLDNNYRPFIQFTNNKILSQVNTPFASNSNFNIFVVARATTNTGYKKIVGFKKSGSSRNDYSSLWLTPTGALEFRDSSLTILTSTSTPSINNNGIWNISYTQGGALTISLNGNTPQSSSNLTLNLPTYYTEYGNNTSNFDLSEIVFYKNNLTDLEKRRIHSYLSLKYGIHYTSNFISGTNDTIWDQSNGGYNSRVFGIGREDCIGIAQKQSHSVTGGINNNDLLKIGIDNILTENTLNNSNLPDAHFIFWGDNNGALTTTNNVRSSAYCLVTPQRTWRAQTTGNLANSLSTQVDFTVSGISGNGWVAPNNNPQDYYLLIDRNRNGLYNDDGDAAIPATKVSGGTLTFKNIKWDVDNNSSDIFTIGYKVATPNAGEDQVLASNSFTMSGSPTIGTWSIVSKEPIDANVIINNFNTYNTSVIIPNGAAATLRWQPSGTGSYCYDDVNLLNTSTILPIELISFSAKLNNNQTDLVWETASEMINKGFEIERSNDAKKWDNIGFVNSQSENGFSNSRLKYDFTDISPLNGINLYRLKQIDFDLKFEYSPIRSVTINPANLIKLYPNPVTNLLSISGLEGNEVIIIFDILGHLICSQNAFQNTQKISFDYLPIGLYSINIIKKDGSSNSYKIIKTK